MNKLLKKEWMIRFVLLIVSLTFTQQLFAQNKPVRFSGNKEQLTSLFSQIEKQTNLDIAYNESSLDINQLIDVKKEYNSLEDALNDILKNTGFTFTINKSNIVIIKKEDNKTQEKETTITGIVVDDLQEPVIGASVKIEGTNAGTITDFDGKFSLSVSPSSTLQISYIGYETKRIKVGNNKILNVTLSEDSKTLQEVVVIGYGVMNKRDVSTSISSVKADQIANTPVTDFRQSLAAKMPGVQVMQTSGDPEGTISMRIRGVSSATAGNEPLYIVDGIPMERGFANLNNNDIESVEVLKDASSAAIYGSRGSNGVVLITTKSGKSERVSVQYDGYVGFQKLSKKIEMLNAYQYAQLSKEGHDNAYMDEVAGASPNDPNSIRPQSYHQIPVELEPYLRGEPGLTDTDWQDEIYRTAPTTSHNISISGKGKNVNYFISGNYYKQDGIIICSDFEKYSMRLNLDGKYDRFRFGVNFAPAYSHSNRVNTSGQYTDGGIVASALSSCPVWPVYNPDGSFNFQGNGYWRLGTDYQHNEILNPVALAHLQKDEVDRMTLLGKVYAEYEIIKGLTYNISAGGDFYGSHNDKYRSSELPLHGMRNYDSKSNPEGYSSSGFYFNWVIENKFNYSRTFGSHSINGVLVQSAQKETYKTNNVTASDYPNDHIQTISGGTVTKGNSDIQQWTLASYLARVQYSYQGKYMVSAAIRMDGSSRFGKNNRWGYFPSASAAWRISDENFFKENSSLGFINDLKLRVSYGQTGNFQINNYEHYSTLSSDDYILGSNNGSLVSGYKPDRVNNDDLKWEKTSMANVGFDLTLWDGLFGLTAEYYYSNTTDMLLSVPIPHLAGHSTSRMNIGKVNNRGVELQVTTQKKIRDFQYSFNANFSKNINEVKALGPGNAPVPSTGSVDHAHYLTEVGKPIGNYYLLVYDGVFQTQEDLEKYPHFDNTKVGDFIFVDVDGDGILDVDKDRTIVGNYMPKFTYGFGSNFSYKGFDLNVVFQGVYGNKILNLNRRYNTNLEGNFNNTIEALDRWVSEENPGNGLVNRANRKTKGNNGRTSTWHLESGSYLRLQNLTVGYTLPAKISRRFYVEKLRVYASGQNLVTFTNYTGYNPEVSNRPTNALSPGEDYGTYPLAKVFTFGLNLTF